MRLDFKILWFENQPNDVKTQIDEIKEYIESVGFIPAVHIETNGANVEAIGIQQELFDDFDLVVVDYELGDPSKQGDWVAEHIRRHFGFTDIIFYSAKRPDDLRKLVFEKGVDGVYCFNRPDLAERLAAHIDQVVKRLSRLEAMRGLTMGVVGKCDDALGAIMRHTFSSAPEDWRKGLEKKLDDSVTSGLEAAILNYRKCGDLEAKLANRAVTSFHLWTTVSSSLANRTECKGQISKLSSYNDEVLTPRNNLAHVVEIRGDTGWVVGASSNPPITTAEFGTLRKSLASHFENIRQIGPLIGMNDG